MKNLRLLSALIALLLSLSALAAQPVVKTPIGLIRGSDEAGILTFKGIPYGRAPLGELRWAPPQAQPVHDGVLDATTLGPACLQTLPADSTRRTSEDCLNLNVWTPALDGTPRPVMVWIHGGGLRAGSSDIPGQVFAERGLVVVSINYRLGPLGFFAHEALSGLDANPAIADMILALQWVAQNIKSFGGDPDNVTIFGVSAGGMAVNLLMVSEAATGLFHRAIAQSGYATWALPRSRHAPAADIRAMNGEPAAAAETLAAELVASVDPDADTRAELYALDGQALVDALDGFQLPIVDGSSLPEEPGLLFLAGRQHAVPYITGGNSFEGSVMPASGISIDEYAHYLADELDTAEVLYADDFTLGRKTGLMRMFGDNRYLLSARVLGGAMQQKTARAWLYYVDFVPPSQAANWLGTPHGMDAYMLFSDPVSDETVTRNLIERMRTYWSNFARTGNPNGDGLLNWPAYDPATDLWLIFSTRDALGEKVLADKLDLLEAHYRNRTRRTP